MSNLKYLKMPYSLSESELTAKPISEIIELVRHIEETVIQIKDDLAIHSHNLKMMREFLDTHYKGDVK